MRLGRVFGIGLSLGVALTASACGSADEKDPNVGKCEDFAGSWCSTAINCLVSLGTLTESARESNFGTCQDAAIAAVPCKKAVGVASTYAQCMEDVQSMNCSVWAVPVDQLGTVKPPATCQGVILISP